MDKWIGVMEKNILVNLKMIKNMVLAHFIGEMVEFMKDNGKMENNMVKVNIQL